MNPYLNPWTIASFAAGLALVTLFVACLCMVRMWGLHRQLRQLALRSQRGIVACSNASYFAHTVPCSILAEKGIATWEEIRQMRKECEREARQFAREAGGMTPGLRLWEQKQQQVV